MMSKKQIDVIFNKGWLLLIEVMIYYSFFFQYGVVAIKGGMVFLALLMIFFLMVQLVKQNGKIRKSNMFPIWIFCLSAVFTTIFVSSNGLYGLDFAIRLMEYLATSYSLCVFLMNNPGKIDNVMWSFCISITLLAVFSFIKGVQVSSSGAKGLESLNSNSMSSYFLIMFFCAFYLMWKERTKIETLMILLMLVIVFVSQIMVASRRGFIVLVFFVFCAISFCFIPYKTGGKSIRRFVWYLFLLLLIVLGIIFVKEYLLQNTVLGARLQGAFDRGDLLRKKYQTFALEQYVRHPVVGIGLGGIAYYMGAYSHSMYYEIFSCTGTVLSMLFLTGLGKMVFSCLKLRKIARNFNKKVVYISSLLLVFLVCILISGIAVVMIYDFYFYISIAIISAIILSLKDIYRKELESRY